MTELVGGRRLRDLSAFVEDAIDQILLREEEIGFFAWVRAEAPRRFPEDFAHLPGEPAARATAFNIARQLWNEVPLPGAGYRVRPIPSPERNTRCPCGSGKKYKRCCGAASGNRLDAPFTVGDGWAAVLLRKSLEEVAQVSAEGRVPRALAPSIAEYLLEVGAPQTALALLAPLFTEPGRLTERDAPAIEPLIDTLDALELYEEKERLVERLRLTLPPPLLLTLWESVGPSFAAQGETGRAWEAVEQIRRVDPDSPVLGGMEVVLLLEENRLTEAADRAAEGLRRHQRKPGLNQAAVLLLRETVRDAAGARRRLLLGGAVFAVERLEALASAAFARPIRPYGVRIREDGSGSARLAPPEDLIAVEKTWMAATDFIDWDETGEDEEDGEEEGAEAWNLDPEVDDDEDDDDRWVDEENDLFADALKTELWLNWLSANPQAFDSLRFLVDLADYLFGLVLKLPELQETLVRPLVNRGLAILEATLAQAPHVTLPGELEENLPALEALNISAYLSGERLPTVESLERILRLDPNDNLGMRGDLGRAYLHSGEPRKALNLAVRFPDDDVPYLSFSKVIALHRLGCTEETLAALDEAVERFPFTAVALAEANSLFSELLLDLWREEEELWQHLRERVPADRLIED